MALIRAFLNNGFFFLVLIVAVTLYLVYSDDVKRDHGILKTQPSQSTTESTDLVTPVISHPEPVKAIETASETSIASKHTAPPVVEMDSSEPIATNIANEEMPQETQNTEDNSLVDSIVEKTQEAVESMTQVVTLEAEPQLHENTVTADEKSASESKNAAPAALAEIEQTSLALPDYDHASLDAILNDSTKTKDIPEFSTTEAAYTAARQAFYDQDYETSEHIYLSMIQTKPTANALGELGNVLFVNNKQDKANRAWLESAKYLIIEDRVGDAYTLANRLRPVAPETAQKIGYQLAKMMAEKYRQQQINNPPHTNSNMPPMQPYRLPAMPAPQAMTPPQYHSQPMPQMPAMQMDPRMIEMRNEQEARYRAYMQHMQQQGMTQPSPMPPPPYTPYTPVYPMQPMQNGQVISPLGQPQFNAPPAYQTPQPMAPLTETPQTN